jgi:flagellar biosynthesis/type III secretory pathway protein FliH
MSSFSLPRAVTIQPGTAGGAAWSPDELPRSSSLPSSGSATVASSRSDEARLSAATEDGYARGYEQGFRAGEFAEAARLRSAIEAVDSALTSIQQEAARWIGNAEENICALAVTVARQVLARELTAEPGLVVKLVQEALKEYPVSERLRVRMNSADLHVVARALEADERALGGRTIRWNSDPRLSPGSCVIEGNERIVDGRVDAGLERLYRRLSNAAS